MNYSLHSLVPVDRARIIVAHGPLARAEVYHLRLAADQLDLQLRALRDLPVPMLALTRLSNYQTLKGSFSAGWLARSRLYQSQILQVNMRWKALAEIYTMHSFAPLANLKIFVKNC